ncbi:MULTISPECIES: GNAT family N-acetyltransferase [Serratia]|uniref:GNAT family N-acetyltransferase n=1 Tax=Serratia TaxID=613 RepID=UPI0011C93B7D|nr:GNAT family N-acetyltransferase [Serratia bockelmannii]MBH2795331.1 GNAT family N-acetyltransferase [Serratia marcescens]TXE45285.1 GNAT family N-acetyltransferase [Serratia bockelmannii]
MEIIISDRSHSEALVDIIIEMEEYYFGPDVIKRQEVLPYLNNAMFGPYSGITVASAWSQGKVCGFCTFCIMHPAPKLSGQMFMKELFVSRTARGLGVGKAMMSFIATIALEHGCSRLDWTAEKSNPNAGLFYRQLGADEIAAKQYFRLENDALRAFARSYGETFT